MLEKMEMWLNAKESFTQMCEDGKMEDGLGGSNDAIEFPNTSEEHGENEKRVRQGHVSQNRETK